jgi:uncharacterized membrane protein
VVAVVAVSMVLGLLVLVVGELVAVTQSTQLAEQQTQVEVAGAAVAILCETLVPVVPGWLFSLCHYKQRFHSLPVLQKPMAVLEKL